MGSDAGSLGRICYRAVNGRIREDPGTGGCQGLYLPDGVLGAGGNGDAHPACLGNAGAGKAFRLRSASFAWATSNTDALPPCLGTPGKGGGAGGREPLHPLPFMAPLRCYHFATQLGGTRQNGAGRGRHLLPFKAPKTLLKRHALERAGMAEAEFGDRWPPTGRLCAFFDAAPAPRAATRPLRRRAA